MVNKFLKGKYLFEHPSVKSIIFPPWLLWSAAVQMIIFLVSLYNVHVFLHRQALALFLLIPDSALDPPGALKHVMSVIIYFKNSFLHSLYIWLLSQPPHNVHVLPPLWRPLPLHKPNYIDKSFAFQL